MASKCLIVTVAFLALGSYVHAVDSKVEDGLIEELHQYVKTNDVDVTIPEGMSIFSGTKFHLSPRNIDSDELDIKVKLPNSEDGKAMEARKKGKLKKILVPIFVLLFIKAITFIPLAIGVLGIKTWNGLQLSFISFVISLGLAIFQMCKKIVAEPPATQTLHVPAYDHHSTQYARGLDSEVVAKNTDAQNLAYRAHA